MNNIIYIPTDLTSGFYTGENNDVIVDEQDLPEGTIIFKNAYVRNINYSYDGNDDLIINEVKL